MSFRQFGGLNYAAKHNIVASNYNTSNNLLVTQDVGQPNSYINFLSDISGNISVYGNFDLSGNLFVSGNVDISNNLDVGGNVDISNNLDVGGNVDISNNLDVGGNVDISGNLDVGGNVDISGNLDIGGNVDISGNLDVGGNVDISGNLTAYYMFLTSDSSYSNIDNAVMPKSYIDLVSSGIKPAGTVEAISTSGVSNTTYPVPISPTDVSANFVVDGYTLSAGDNVLLNDQTNEVDNGVYQYINIGSGNYQFQRSTTILPTGSDALGSFIFVQYGSINSRTGWIETMETNGLAIVGTDELFFHKYYSLNFKPGLGLNITSTGSGTVSYLNVDTSLNFINYLDSKTGVTGANGTLAIGTNTTNSIVIGPTGNTVPIQTQSIIQAQKGITGPTGSFTYLTANDGSFNYLSATTGSFTYLNASGGISSQGTITGPTGSFTYLNASGGISSQGTITGPTGSFTYLNASGGISSQGTITGPTGSFTYLNASGGISSQGTITGPTGSFTYLNASGGISSQGTITGPTGSFTYLNASGGISSQGTITGPTGSFTYLLVSNQSIHPAGITGSTGSFDYLSATTGSFSYLSAIDASFNSLSATTGSFGYLSANDASFNYLSGYTGSFTYLSVNKISLPSDYRIKENIISLNNSFNIDKLVPVTYINKKTYNQDIGLIAHQVQEHYPFLVDGEKDGEELQTINYIGLIPILIREIQELKKEVKTLKEKIKNI
jgi:glucan-binding YG repeat protein/cytoskeletal protein CcmA (bactofilin family)